MKLGYTILYVENVNETIAFYNKAFGFQKKFISPEGDYGELISGETTIAFASQALGNSNFKKGFQMSDQKEKPFGIELAFVSERVEEDYRTAIDAGASELEPLTEKPWGQKVGYVRDINGFIIEICSPVKSD